jgi:MoxR-like ATPase
MVGLYMDFYDAETETEIVNTHIGDGLSSDEVETLVDILRELRDELDLNVGTRAEIMAAEGLAAAGTYDDELYVETCVDVLASKVASLTEVTELRDHVESVVDSYPTVGKTN